METVPARAILTDSNSLTGGPLAARRTMRIQHRKLSCPLSQPCSEESQTHDSPAPLQTQSWQYPGLRSNGFHVSTESKSRSSAFYPNLVQLQSYFHQKSDKSVAPRCHKYPACITKCLHFIEVNSKASGRRTCQARLGRSVQSWAWLVSTRSARSS